MVEYGGDACRLHPPRPFLSIGPPLERKYFKKKESEKHGRVPQRHDSPIRFSIFFLERIHIAHVGACTSRNETQSLDIKRIKRDFDAFFSLFPSFDSHYKGVTDG